MIKALPFDLSDKQSHLLLYTSESDRNTDTSHPEKHPWEATYLYVREDQGKEYVWSVYTLCRTPLADIPLRGEPFFDPPLPKPTDSIYHKALPQRKQV